MTSMFNTSDFIYIHIYVWLSGRTHRAGISDSISAPAPCSLLSLVTVPGKLGLLERGNTLQSAVGVFAWASLLLAPRFRFPGKAGRAAGRCKGGPEETILPRRGHHVTDGITAVNLPTLQSLPCHAKPATTRPCLQPGVCSLRRWNRQPKASPGIPARPCRHPRMAAPGPEQPPARTEGLRGTNYFQMPGSEAQGKREAQVCTWVCSQHKEGSSST